MSEGMEGWYIKSYELERLLSITKTTELAAKTLVDLTFVSVSVS